MTFVNTLYSSFKWLQKFTTFKNWWMGSLYLGVCASGSDSF